jgi:hypothetical protein
LPLNLDEVHKEVQLAFGRSHYESLWKNECVTEQRKKHPNQTSFSIPHMPEERRKEFEAALGVSIERGELFNAPNIHDCHELKVISSLLIQLSDHDKLITKHTLPLPDLNVVADYRHYFSNYSRERIIEYVESFFFKAIESYKKNSCNKFFRFGT